MSNFLPHILFQVSKLHLLWEKQVSVNCMSLHVASDTLLISQFNRLLFLLSNIKSLKFKVLFTMITITMIHYSIIFWTFIMLNPCIQTLGATTIKAYISVILMYKMAQLKEYM